MYVYDRFRLQIEETLTQIAKTVYDNGSVGYVRTWDEFMLFTNSIYGRLVPLGSEPFEKLMKEIGAKNRVYTSIRRVDSGFEIRHDSEWDTVAGNSVAGRELDSLAPPVPKKGEINLEDKIRGFYIGNEEKKFLHFESAWIGVKDE